ncbi:MAG: diguanylate cyclase domain-containing protein [Tissierella sp.]|uniref:diguanylate cyclase domain-containing protein n=1 Tax=Tissierella sp. TaxID=41274 RepID=UPI003F989572
MESSNKRVGFKSYWIAFCISLGYIILMLIAGALIEGNVSNAIGRLSFFRRENIYFRYIEVITLSGIFVFIMTCLVIKKIDKDKDFINDNYKKIKERELAIKTATKQIEKQSELIYSVLENASIFIIQLDKNFNINNASKNIKDIIEFEVEDMRNKPLSRFIEHEYVQEIKSEMQYKDIYELEIEIYSKYGKRVYIYGTVKKDIKNYKGDKYYTFVLYDISKRKSLQQKIRYLDSYDSLTDLPNRNLMERIFTSLLPRLNKEGNPGALLFIDIDHFAFINETKGHHAGDHLLMDMANILKDIKEDGDVLGRITQDKFVMIITGEKSLEDIDKKIDNITKKTNVEWEFEDKKYMVSTTIGVSTYPKDGVGFIVLLKSANLALECAKESERTSYEYYNKEKNV